MITSFSLTCCSSLFRCIILDFRTLAFFPKIDLFFVVLIRDTFDFRDLPLEEPYMEFFLLSADFLCFRGLRWSELKTTFLTITPRPLLMLIFVAQSLSFSFSYLFVFARRFYVHPLLFAFAFSLDAQFSSGKRALGSRVAEFQIELGKGRTQHRLKCYKLLLVLELTKDRTNAGQWYDKMRAHFELWKSFTIDQHGQVNLSQTKKDGNENQIG